MSEEAPDLDAVLGIDPEDLDATVRNRLQTYVADREDRLVELRLRAVEAEEEATALERKLDQVQHQKTVLEDHLKTPDDLTVLDPGAVFATFGEALTSERLEDTGFTVSDVSVDLRANVVQTEDGVRLHLPTPGSEVSAGLSDFHFAVRTDPDRPDLDYETVPDLLGMDRETAVATIERAGFELGRDETAPADAAEGTVIEQLPSPFALADPGAAIDIVTAEPSATEMVDLLGRTLPDAVHFVGDRFTLRDITAVESDAPPGTVLDQDPAPGADIAESEGLSLTISAFREAPSDRSGSPSLGEMDVTDVNGIGETYGERLRAAGFTTLADLVDAEPIEVAEAAEVSRDRARDWIEVVHHLGSDESPAEERDGEGE